MTKAREDQALARKVAEREALIKEIAAFAEGIAQRHGRVLSRDQGSSHTRVVRELANFGGFTFFTDGTHTIMGGHDVKITRHASDGARVVFEIYYQTSIDYCEVKAFVDDKSWLKALRRVMRDEAKITKKIVADAKIEADRRTAEREQQARNNELRKTAERLGV